MGTNGSIKQLGILIKNRREAAGYSARGLGAKAGVNDSTIVRLEQGARRSPRPDVLAKLAAVLNIDVADMFALAGYEVPGRLPSFQIYLKERYSYLPKPAQDELVTYMKHLHGRYDLDEEGRRPL